MKQLLVFAIVLGFSWTGSLYAQTQRLVMLEHFTQASCPPCATWNPVVQNIIDANPGKITFVKYHTSWPGYDPMNLHNPQEVAARVSVYGVTGVPYSVLDGNHYAGSPANWNTNTLNARYAVPSPVEMQFQHWLSPNQDSIHVMGIVKATAAVSGNLNLMVAVIEKQIQFSTPPGSNGESLFKNVMKKLLPNQTGTTLPGSMSPGEYMIFKGSWKLANVYSIAQLGVVAWVQDKTTREIHQAANSTTSPLTPPYPHDLAVQQVLGIGDKWCLDEVAPRLILRNQGSQVITAAEIRYSVNGGTAITHNWTGNLAFMEEVEVSLPTSSITLSASNTLAAFIHKVNNQPDDHANNDTLRRSFSEAPQTTSPVFLFLKVDNKPQEVTWDLTDSQGNILHAGGPYTQNGQTIQQTFTLSQTGCYTFSLRDAGGDGICCTNGYGVYQLSSNIPNQVLGEGDHFGREAIHAFVVAENIGMEDPVSLQNVQLFPNPASAEVQLSFDLIKPQVVDVLITDLSGRHLVQGPSHVMTAGRHMIPLTTKELSQGMYLLHLTVDGKAKVIKLQVSR